MERVVEEGVVVEYNGKFWGKLYADGHSISYGWGDIKQAKISRDLDGKQYANKPEDFTSGDSHYIRELRKGRLLRIRRITSFEIV